MQTCKYICSTRTHTLTYRIQAYRYTYCAHTHGGQAKHTHIHLVTRVQCPLNHSQAKHTTGQHSTSQQNTSKHDTTHNSTAQSTEQHNTTRHSKTQYRTKQHNPSKHITTQQRIECGDNPCMWMIPLRFRVSITSSGETASRSLPNESGLHHVPLCCRNCILPNHSLQ